MEEVYAFLKKCQTYYLASMDGHRPRVRPFGTIHIFENRLYFQTGKQKNVSRQIRENPHIEICGMIGNKWIRIEAIAREDDRREARQSMLDAYPSLQSFYKADDGNTEVFYLTEATATFSSFSEKPETICF